MAQDTTMELRTMELDDSRQIIRKDLICLRCAVNNDMIFSKCDKYDTLYGIPYDVWQGKAECPHFKPKAK